MMLLSFCFLTCRRNLPTPGPINVSGRASRPLAVFKSEGRALGLGWVNPMLPSLSALARRILMCLTNNLQCNQFML
jgi:hypothetical protein